MSDCERFTERAADGLGERPWPADVTAHAAACASCGELLRHLELLRDEPLALAPEPDEARWLAFDEALARRLVSERPRARRRSAARWTLPVAAGLAAAALLLFLRQGDPVAEPGVQTDALASASVDGVDEALEALGFETSSDDEWLEDDEALSDLGTLGAAWEDPVASLERELEGALDEDAQGAVAAMLQEASPG